MLFGECGSVIIVSLNEKDLYELVLIAKKYDINTQTIGYVSADSTLKINNSININKDILSEHYFNTLENIIDTENE